MTHKNLVGHRLVKSNTVNLIKSNKHKKVYRYKQGGV